MYSKVSKYDINSTELDLWYMEISILHCLDIYLPAYLTSMIYSLIKTRFSYFSYSRVVIVAVNNIAVCCG